MIEIEAFTDLSSEFAPAWLVMCWSELSGEVWHSLYGLN
jgi:hypothetical protein